MMIWDTTTDKRVARALSNDEELLMVQHRRWFDRGRPWWRRPYDAYVGGVRIGRGSSYRAAHDIATGAKRAVL